MKWQRRRTRRGSSSRSAWTTATASGRRRASPAARHVAHDARRARARDDVPLPRRRALAERADAETRGSFRTDPWPGSTAATAVPAAADAAGHHGQRIAVRPPPALPPRRDAGPADNAAAASPLPPGTPLVESSSPLRVNGNAVFPRMVWRQCPTLLPDVHRRRHQRLPRRELLEHRGAVRPPRRQGDVDGRRLAPRRLAAPARSAGTSRTRPTSPSASATSSRSRRAHGRVTFLTLTDQFSATRSAPHEGPIYPGLLRQRRRHRLRHVSRRGALHPRADRQRLLDAARARRADERQADVPVDRGGADGALPRERGSDARRRPRRDVARDRGRRPRHRLLPRLLGGGASATRCAW